MRKHDKNPTKATKAAAAMPSLRHQLPGEDFAWNKSEVIHWLSQQPEIQKALFDYYRATGAIVFDQKTGTWKGVEVKE